MATGVCRVCGGEVVKKKEQVSSGSQSSIKIVGDYYYCQQCGIRFEFIPPQLGG